LGHLFPFFPFDDHHGLAPPFFRLVEFLFPPPMAALIFRCASEQLPALSAVARHRHPGTGGIRKSHRREIYQAELETFRKRAEIIKVINRHLRFKLSLL
jgi:hypothetical protein